MGCGSALLGTGGVIVVTLLIWAWTAATANLFSNRLFDAAIALFALMFLVGLYALASPHTGWWMPPVRSEPWRPWQRLFQYRLRITVIRPPGGVAAVDQPMAASEPATEGQGTRAPAYDLPDLDNAQLALLRQLVKAFQTASRDRRGPFECFAASSTGLLGPPPINYAVDHAGLPEGRMIVSRYDLEALEHHKCITAYPQIFPPTHIKCFEVTETGRGLASRRGSG